jgi:hypothetical protein
MGHDNAVYMYMYMYMFMYILYEVCSDLVASSYVYVVCMMIMSNRPMYCSLCLVFHGPATVTIQIVSYSSYLALAS